MIARVLMTLGLLSIIEPIVFPRKERVRVVYMERQAEPDLPDEHEQGEVQSVNVSAGPCQCLACIYHRGEEFHTALRDRR